MNVAEIESQEVEKLIDALDRLRLIEKDIVDVLHRVTARRTGRTEQPDPEVAREPSEEQTRERGARLLPTSRIRKWDLIRIKNPRTGQQRKGVAIGSTNSLLYIKVRTPNGTVINRTPGKLTIISQDEFDQCSLW